MGPYRKSRFRRLAALLASTVVVLSLIAASACAQESGRVYRVGVPMVASRDMRTYLAKSLAELGFIEGQNLIIDERCCSDKPEVLKDFVRELVGIKVDVIVASSPPAARAAQAVTTTIPIVFIGVANPVELGLVTSLARPGGNITGLTHVAGAPGELLAKHMQLIKEAVPSATRLGIVINPTNPIFKRPDINVRRTVAEAAKRIGVTAEVVEAPTKADLTAAFAPSGARGRVDAFVVTGDPMFFAERAAIAELAANARVPAIYWFREHADAGGMMAYATDLNALARRAGTYVQRIVNGANPAELPVEQATIYELTINMKTVRALKLHVPSTVLVRADRVIE